jgi:starch synthase
MNIIHISAECFPVAKVGGLADVVGALPKYQSTSTTKAQVIMPFYDNAFSKNNSFKSIYESVVNLGANSYTFSVKVLNEAPLDFDVFFIDIPDLLFKTYIYSAEDTERFLAFQIATLNWILTWGNAPDVIHCHDHHTGLIPFMLQESHKYKALKYIPNVLTIHNAQYQGGFSHENVNLIPEFNFNNVGLLDWNGYINPLAAAIKCAWKVTTVSPSYMEELKEKANGLEGLLREESGKCSGILNGIDWNVWNPETDTNVIANYNTDTIESGRKANKAYLCERFNLDVNKPLFGFIGRLVYEKGSDLFPEVIKKSLENNTHSILLLGSGNKDQEQEFENLKSQYEGSYNAYIGYDEKLSHIVYAGADFLLMPSRVEPCGLNQMYCLRYGTIPIVRSIGGLKDTVTDISQENGFGICHENVEALEISNAIERGITLYNSTQKFNQIRKQIMEIDHSWNASAQAYINLYKQTK